MSQLVGLEALGYRILWGNPVGFYQLLQRLICGLHAIESAALHDLLYLIEFASLDVVLAGVGIDQNVVISGPFAVGCFKESLGYHAEQ